MDALFAYFPLWIITVVGGALFVWARRSPFGEYVLRRYLLALVTLLIVSIVLFILMETIPGDCVTRYIAYKNTQGERITEELLEAERVRRGLDRSLIERWFDWSTGFAFQGDLGFSCLQRAPVAQLLGDRFWISLGICFAGLIVAYLIALPMGVVSAAILTQPWFDRDDRRSPIHRVTRSFGLVAGKIFEFFLRMISYLGLALPNFVIALFVLTYYVQQGWDQPFGLASPEFAVQPWVDEDGYNWPKLFDFLSYMGWPIFILGWAATALQVQTVRALVIDEANKLYVVAARARGQHGAGLWMKYPVRHSIGPLINSVGFDFNRIFNDLPIVALLLTLTEAGNILIDALARSNDAEVAASILMLVTLTIISLNFITDVMLALLDPRFRRGLQRA